jgi:hypothetical protein
LKILRKNSTKREDDEEEVLSKEEKKKKRKIGAYDQLQVPNHSLGGYSHRERWSHTRLKVISRRTRKENFKSMDSTFTPIGRADSRTQRFWPLY